MPDNRIQFRADPDLRGWLEGRAARAHSSVEMQARAEIETWRLVLAAELRRIPLTLAEACAIADVFNGHAPTAGMVPHGVGMMYAGCYEEFQMAREGSPAPDVNSYGTKWEIDENTLLHKLRRLGPAADLALEDAIGRWWATSKEATVEGFTQVGIRIIDVPPRDNAGESED